MVYENGLDKMENIFNIEDNIKKIKEMFENKDIKELLKEQKDEILKKFSDLKKKIEAEDGDFIKTIEEKLKLIKNELFNVNSKELLTELKSTLF